MDEQQEQAQGGTQDGAREELSLTEGEAAARAALISVERYDLEVDLRDLLTGEVLSSVSTTTFSCREPGAETFVDCLAEIESATLNGIPLDPGTARGGRLPLPGLAEHNVLEVRARQGDTGRGAGVLRSVDPSDLRVYVWTSFEPDDARRLWACFDQPDLKAVHRFTVHAPESWTVTSNVAPDGVDDPEDGARTWRFGDTPPLSTYVVVVNAGPFHELRQQRGGHSLGLYCRQSLRAFLERDAEELFTLTEQGLAFFGERFDQPFPQERYDQVFVPSMGGAMENWGCVTWTDAALHRSEPTHGQRATVASILLHEMAHMWFGDLVTMTWWDDLWLNEAFASWAACWASVGATAYTDDWATFLAGEEQAGYRADMSPATHPIRGEVPDVSQAVANFDQITYLKGQAVLKQLVAYVGEEAFVAGLRAYFREHAWGNTRLADLMDAVGAAAGRDLSGWTTAWFDRAGTDTLALVDGAVVATGPSGGEVRPHRLAIASYALRDGTLHPVGVTEVETAGLRTPVDLPDADLHLLNHDDLTFASVRTDERSLRTLLEHAAALPDALSRALAVGTAWDMLAQGELSSEDLLGCLLGVLRTERSPGVVEPFLDRALAAAEIWSPTVAVAHRLAEVAAVAAELAEVPDLRAAALRTLAASASSPAHFLLLDTAAADDPDLAWRVLARRAALGSYDADAVAALRERDTDPDVGVRELAVRAARPEESAKQEAWTEIFERGSVPVGPPLRMVAAAFWGAADQESMLPWAHRYLDEVARPRGGGMLATMALTRAMAPRLADRAFVERARAVAADPATPPVVRTTLLLESDTIDRALRARG